MRNVESKRAVRVLEAVCSALLAVLTANAAFELFVWLAWHKSFAALEEIQGVLVVWLGLLTAAYCLAEGLHLAVDVIARRLPTWSRPVLTRVPGIANAAFGALLAVFGARLVLAIDNTLPGTGWSAAIQYQPAVVAGALIAWFGLVEALGRPRAKPERRSRPTIDQGPS